MAWLSERLADTSAGLLVLPGAHDGLTAKLIAGSKAEAVYCGGFATAAVAGLPDLGLLSFEEISGALVRIVEAAGGKPVVADGDAGHGGLLNVERTIHRLGRIGVSAVHIEDQVAPKRCGHLDGKMVVSRDEAIARIATAVAAGRKAGVEIIGRTDALGPEGLDEALWRAEAFYKTGVVAVLVDAPRSAEEVRTIAENASAPVVFNAAPTGSGPALDHKALQTIGIAAVIHPIEGLLAATAAVEATLRTLVGGKAQHCGGFDGINEILGTHALVSRERALWQTTTNDLGRI